MPLTRDGICPLPTAVVELPTCLGELRQAGCSFAPPSSSGMKQLQRLWKLSDEEAAWASTWLPTALMARMSRLDALLQMLEADRAVVTAWLAQIESFDWSGHEQPELDGEVELVLSDLIRRMQPLLRTELRALLPWVGRRLWGRLVYACVATVLQQGREVVVGAPALGTGRTNCDVLCNLSTDAALGTTPTVFSTINLLTPRIIGQLAEGVTLFSRLRRARASSGPFARHSDSFVRSGLVSEHGCCASAVLPPDCPDDDDAPELLSCAHPESPGMVNLVARQLIFIASGPTHHMHSMCKPDTIAERAADALQVTIPTELLAGASVQKEQCFPIALRDGAGGLRLALRTATDLGVDTEQLFRSTVEGSDLVFQLNPSAVNLAALALQPSASSEQAVEQMALVAQVLSMVNSTSYRSREINGMRLLTDVQLERSEALITASNTSYLSTLPKRQRYQ